MTSEEKDKIVIKRARRRVYEAPEPEPQKPEPVKQELPKAARPKTATPKSATPKTPKPVETVKEKEFPSIRTRGKAEDIVKKNIYWSMGIALLPFPIFDMAALTALQVKMAHDISKTYNKSFNQSRGKAVILSLLGSLNIYALSSLVFRGFMKLLPGPAYLLGAASSSGFSAATTYAVGKVFIQHYEMGGTLLDLDPDAVKEYFREQYQKELKGRSKEN